jgi:pimeloyl-ACP methyl ester carboxylesterase
VRDGLSSLAVPTTVVVGARDRLTPTTASQEIADLLAERGVLHRYVELPGIGHCPNIEAPTAFDAEVRELLALSQSAAVG